MKKFRSTLAIALAFSVVAAFFMVIASTGNVYAQDTRIVRIHGGASFSTKSIRLEPEILSINKGSVVVWNNWARASEVKIIFEEGKICQDVTEAPMGFSLDARQCYVTTWTPLGGTSSLRFVQKGTYDYVVETTGGIKAKGKIQVR